ncbi:hypothetical protein [Marinobacterium arenosum]|uniref:hypothetical protein n=1 Tax=Marinobacterium arenosum TaxID=2862496 RepID=UPI001C943ECF|nr:hypothetical protein [Marinobacterium arenosum]MBY4676289.1 hypothetical protein [Marinobacterium arenosum]
MRVADFKTLAGEHHIKNVNFVESSCGPMVIEVEFERGQEVVRDLIKDSKGNVITYTNITQAYDVCSRAGVHRANLVQVIPHDEACVGMFAEYHRDAIPLKF